ncbi:MAG: slipin family protein, partial [Nanoarchaeota archaeon]
HIELPEDMKRVMAKAAEAERLRRAVVIRSEGDADASARIAEAAALIGKTEGALHLRTLQSLSEIASDDTNNVYFFIPLDIIKSYTGGSRGGA